MAGPFAYPVFQALKIITPADINQFNQVAQEYHKISLSRVLAQETGLDEFLKKHHPDAMLHKDEMDNIRILRNDYNVKRRDKAASRKGGKKSKEGIDKIKASESKGTLNDKEKTSSDQKKKDKEEGQRNSASSGASTMFFLDEKKKCQKIQEILRKKAVMDSYEESASVDIHQERIEREEGQNSSNQGTLFDKKHF